MPSSGQDHRVNLASTSNLDHGSRIRAQNDQLRRTLAGGKVMLTSGVEALGVEAVTDIVASVSAFDAFSPSNDPYAEHDFGATDCGQHRIFWKIDYYDRSMTQGSPDPADPLVTTRVLTIMLASEY